MWGNHNRTPEDNINLPFDVILFSRSFSVLSEIFSISIYPTWFFLSPTSYLLQTQQSLSKCVIFPHFTWQRFSRGHLARTRSRTRPLVEFFRGRGRDEEFFPFPRPFRGRDEEFLGISAFFSAILRTRLLILVFRGRGRDEARNFASFLGHFEVETRPSRTSGQNVCNVYVLFS